MELLYYIALLGIMAALFHIAVILGEIRDKIK
jgi:hypothetical protein